MARIRSIKPEFFTSVTVADLTRDARLAWIGLWTHVDDVGRCPDEPRLIKAALFPLDDDMTADAVERLLDELAIAGRIIRYEVDSRRFLEVIGFRDHQRIDKPRASKFPPRPFDEHSTNDRRTIHDTSQSARRHVGDASSPDQDQDQGSGNRDQDSRTTPRRDVDDLVDRVVSRLVDRRAAGKRGSYRMKVRTTILDGAELDDIRRACIEAGSTDIERIVAYHEERRPRYEAPPPAAPKQRDGTLRVLDVASVVPLTSGGAS